MKSFDDIKLDLSKAMSGSYERNLKCAEDYEFAVVAGAMWRGSYAEQFKNKPKPEINLIFSSINRLLGQKERLEMNAKIISNSDDATDDDADLLQSRWRNDFSYSDGVEAINNSDQEAFFSGFGAIKLLSKYEDEENPSNEKQNLCIEPVTSAASSVIYGPSSKKDKSDCRQAWQLIRVNRLEMEREYGDGISSINSSDWFDWTTDSSKDLFIAHYYEVITKKLNVFDFGGYVVTSGDGIKDQYGNELTREELRELRDEREHDKTTKTVKFVEYALISGDRILEKPRKTPFKRVPIIPQYGYYSVINGIEHYCGEVRRRRDPQMFTNTYFSALLEIMSAPQVEKPEYTPDQIARHASDRDRADIDGSSFVMSDPVYDPITKQIVKLGPIGVQSPPQIGTGLAAAGQQLQTVLFEMGGSGSSTVPSNAASDAIRQVNERQDDAFQPLMQNSMHTIKAACETWIPAAQKLYFTNSRNIRTIGADGSVSSVETVQYGEDAEYNYGPNKNTARGRYAVTVKAGESHKNKKEAELDTTLKMLNFADTGTPQGQLLLNQAIISTTGEGGSRARKVAAYQIIDTLLSAGIDPEPKTEDEKKYVQAKLQQLQSQKNAPPLPDPAAIMAQTALNESIASVKNAENRAAEIRLQQGKAMLDAKAKGDKLQSDIMVAAENIEQNQQKIDNKKIDDAVRNGLEIAKFEAEQGRQMDGEIASNAMAGM